MPLSAADGSGVAAACILCICSSGCEGEYCRKCKDECEKLNAKAQGRKDAKEMQGN